MPVYDVYTSVHQMVKLRQTIVVLALLTKNVHIRVSAKKLGYPNVKEEWLEYLCGISS